MKSKIAEQKVTDFFHFYSLVPNRRGSSNNETRLIGVARAIKTRHEQERNAIQRREKEEDKLKVSITKKGSG